jgi:hypothetical protein
MAGGLINIVSYGFNDLYLTGSPEITLFKVVYRRHTNFSKESIDISIGQLDFGEEITVNIPKIADLCSNTYLQLEIPEMLLNKMDIVDEMTDYQKTYFMSNLQIDMTQNEIDIVNSYDTIQKFIMINSTGYRTAFSNQNVKNQSPINYIDSIINSMNYANHEDVLYKDALTNAGLFESSNNAGLFESTNKFNDMYIFDNTMSDINYILGNLKEKLINDIENNIINNYNIKLILKIVVNALNTSGLVKKYFFSKVQKKYNLDTDAQSYHAKFAWVEKLGHAIIDRVDINIGGERIDRHYGDWMNILYELTSYPEQDELYNKMIGNVKIMTSFDRKSKPIYTLIIPLNFWFCKKYGLSVPLIALQYSPISITIKLKSIDECAYLEKVPEFDDEGSELGLVPFTLSDIWDNLGYKINGNLLIEFIYLDELERKRFAQSAHEYLIESVEQMTITNINKTNQQFNLDFMGPSKEIIWHLKKDAYNGNNSNYIKRPFDYSMNKINNNKYEHREKINPFTDAHLLLNGKERFFLDKYFDKFYYSIIQPMSHHTRIPSEGINVYSFSLFPEEHQPSSTCNFTLISSSTMILNIEPNMFFYMSSDIDPSIQYNSDNDKLNTTSLTLTLYSQRYNVLRFIGGNGGFAYSYGVSK